MNFGPSQPAKTEQKVVQELSPEQQQLLNLAMPKLQEFAASKPKMNATTVGFNPTQQQGQQMALDTAGDQGATTSSAAAMNRRFTAGEFLDPGSNPALQAYMKSATQPIQQNLVESTLPALRSEDLLTGNIGGTREGVAQGRAAEGASRAIGATTSSIANEGYKSGLDATLKAMGFAPTIAQAENIPAATVSAVGDVQQQQAQREADTANQIANYDAWLPYIQGSALAGASSGIRGGSTTTTGKAEAPQTNPLQQMVGVGLQMLPFLL